MKHAHGVVSGGLLFVLLGVAGCSSSDAKPTPKPSDINITATMRVDLSAVGVAWRDLLGVVKSPLLVLKNSGDEVDLTDAYRLAGISEVREHDDEVDLCKIYTDDTAHEDDDPADYGETCRLPAMKDFHHMTWRVNDTTRINNPTYYDFTEADRRVQMATEAGAKIYLRLGESWLGPNDTDNPNTYATVATNIYQHYTGHFGSLGFSPTVSAVEIHNESDGRMFWRGDATKLHTLVQKSIDAIHSDGKNIPVGGAGFTAHINDNLNRTDSTAYQFISNVGADRLDFFSAHFYGECETAQLHEFLTWGETLRTQIDTQGMRDKPIHLTEWNIGTGIRCSSHATNAFDQPHMLTYTAGLLLLAQHPSLNITHAHFYAGHGAPMALFTPRSMRVQVNKAYLAFYAHKHFAGMEQVDTKICDSNASCVETYAHVQQGNTLLAQGYTHDGKHAFLFINDSDTAQGISLELSGLSSNTTATMTTYTPPEENALIDLVHQDDGTYTPDPAQLEAYITNNTTQKDITLSNKTTLSLPAYSLAIVSTTRVR